MGNQSNVDFRLRNDFISQFDAYSFLPGEWGDGPPPKLDWLVDGCFPAGTVALVSGDGGLGKSLLMQQLCTAAAIGRSWLGLQTRKVKSYALFCEDDKDELWRRQTRINAHYSCGMGDLEDIVYCSRPGLYNVLAEFRRDHLEPIPTQLFHQVWDKCTWFGAQLIVIDTASDVFGGNEIAKTEVRAFITLLRRLAIACNACVILTAHVSNEGLLGSGLSGSRAWSNSVRSRLWLTSKSKDDPAGTRYLRTMKSNVTKSGSKLSLDWKDGVFVRSEPPATRLWNDADWAAD